MCRDVDVCVVLLLLDDDGAVGEFVFYATDVLLDPEDTSAEGLCDYQYWIR